MLAATSCRRNRAHTAAPISSPMSTPSTTTIVTTASQAWPDRGRGDLTRSSQDM
jgi:hypothetical protein